jgi:hypothetical protein
MTNRNPIPAICLALLLGGCQNAAVMPFGTPHATPTNTKQTHFYDRRDLMEYCVTNGGTFTTNKTACVIDTRRTCEQVTQPDSRDTPQWDQLNAMCDSLWRPTLVIG